MDKDRVEDIFEKVYKLMKDSFLIPFILERLGNNGEIPLLPFLLVSGNELVTIPEDILCTYSKSELVKYLRELAIELNAEALFIVSEAKIKIKKSKDDLEHVSLYDNPKDTTDIVFIYAEFWNGTRKFEPFTFTNNKLKPVNEMKNFDRFLFRFENVIPRRLSIFSNN